jgi:hypothetical protein
MRIGSDSCVKIKDLGFTSSMHINMYGQRFEIVSEPFDEGDGISVRATSGSDPEVRTLRLPIAILIGRADRFLATKGEPALKLAVGAVPSAPSREPAAAKGA